MNEKKGS